MTTFKKLLVSLFHSFAYDFVKRLLVFVFSSGFSFAGIFNILRKINIPLWCVILLATASSALITFISLLIYQAISSQYTQAEKIQSNYEILEKNVSFKYDGATCYYNAEIKLLFNVTAREYYGKFYWSGSGDGRIKTVNPNHKLNILKKRTRYIEYVVVFDKAYRKGKKLTFKLAGVMADPERKFSPYFATTICDPTRKLVMTLDIDPDKYPISDLEKECIPPASGKHEDAQSVRLDEAGMYVWEILKPKLSYQYSLNWTFLG